GQCISIALLDNCLCTISIVTCKLLFTEALLLSNALRLGLGLTLRLLCRCHLLLTLAFLLRFGSGLFSRNTRLLCLSSKSLLFLDAFGLGLSCSLLRKDTCPLGLGHESLFLL